MSGTLFVIVVPKAEYEEKLKNANGPEVYVQKKCSNCDSHDEIIDDDLVHSSDNCQARNVTFIDRSNNNENDNEIRSENKPNLHNDDVLIDEVCSEKILSDVLHALNIHDSAWIESRDTTYWQVSFGIQDQVRSERTLRILRGADLGTRPHTSLCVLPCSLYYKSTDIRNTSEGPDEVVSQSTWSNFVQSVSARQTVAQVVEQIKSDAAFTFDYCFLIIVAALLAAIGLVENSTVFIVASMLISPLMGPIVAGSFGTAIKDRNLLKMGVIHELYGLFICLIIGFIFGIIVSSVGELYGLKELPTAEILSRSSIRSLWVGVLVALPSGAAVSIAILANNVSSLVGVAISASLLPPAVNAGLLWAMSLIQWICVLQQKKSRFTKTNIFSDDPVIELGINGSISLCLTLVNIGCIYLAGILVYKIKEVAPATFNDSDFWRNAIKAVRDYNKSHTEDSRRIHKSLNNSKLRDLTVSCSGIRRSRYNATHKELFKKIRCMGSNNMTWSPYSGIAQRSPNQPIPTHQRRYSENFSANKPHVLTGNQSPTYKIVNAENMAGSTISFSFAESSPNFKEIPSESTVLEKKSSKFTVVSVHKP